MNDITYVEYITARSAASIEAIIARLAGSVGHRTSSAKGSTHLALDSLIYEEAGVSDGTLATH